MPKNVLRKNEYKLDPITWMAKIRKSLSAAKPIYRKIMLLSAFQDCVSLSDSNATILVFPYVFIIENTNAEDFFIWVHSFAE